MARRYQIVMKPIATATGEPGKWSMRAHGATFSKQEADCTIAGLRALGYIARKLPI